MVNGWRFATFTAGTNRGATSESRWNVEANGRRELIQAKGLGDEGNGSRLECLPLQVRLQPPGAENDFGGPQCRLAAGPAAEFKATAIGHLIVMSMGYLIKIHGSQFRQARFLNGDGKEVQRSTGTNERRQAEAILAGWALQAHSGRQPGLCRTRLRQVSAEMSPMVGRDTTPGATYQATPDLLREDIFIDASVALWFSSRGLRAKAGNRPMRRMSSVAPARRSPSRLVRTSP